MFLQGLHTKERAILTVIALYKRSWQPLNLTTVLMDYNGPISNLFEKIFQEVFPFSSYCLLITILCETRTIKHQQMAKMNVQVLKHMFELNLKLLYIHVCRSDLIPFRLRSEG